MTSTNILRKYSSKTRLWLVCSVEQLVTAQLTVDWNRSEGSGNLKASFAQAHEGRGASRQSHLDIRPSLLIPLQEGEPILQLPEKDVELVRLEFSEDERQVRCLSMMQFHHLDSAYSCTTTSRKRLKFRSTSSSGRELLSRSTFGVVTSASKLTSWHQLDGRIGNDPSSPSALLPSQSRPGACRANDGQSDNNYAYVRLRVLMTTILLLQWQV